MKDEDYLTNPMDTVIGLTFANEEVDIPSGSGMASGHTFDNSTIGPGYTGT